MSDGQYRHCAVIDAVHNHITAVTEVNQPFTESCIQIVNRAAEPGLSHEHVHARADRLDRAPRCGCVLIGKETVEAGNRLLGSAGPNQPWHAGGSTSSPASSFARYASISS